MNYYVIMYLLGTVLAYGFYIGAMYKLEIDDIGPDKPLYETAHHDMLGYVFSALSWIGIFIIIIGMLGARKIPTIKYSYKKLWDKYHSQKQTNDA
jgi:hypothetical protein